MLEITARTLNIVFPTVLLVISLLVLQVVYAI